MASKYVQTNRSLKVFTPLPENTILIERFEGVEEFSRPFAWDLDLIASIDEVIDFSAIMGQGMTVTVASADGATVRYFHGIVHQLTQGQQVGTATGDAQFLRYRAQLVPDFFLMKRTRKLYIYQLKTVIEIVSEILGKHKVVFENKTTTTYPKRNYCTQYRESDFDFVSRLLEEEGIAYYFKHENNKHTMILADASGAYAEMAGVTELAFKTAVSGDQAVNLVTRWEKTQTLASGKMTFWDQKFEMAENHLEATQTAGGSTTAGTVSHALDAGAATAQEIYDYPGGYADWFDGITPGGAENAADLNKIFTENKRVVKIRLEEELRRTLEIRGQGNCRFAGAGYNFQLAEHPNANGAYVFTQVKHVADMSDAYTSNRAVKINYFHTFAAIPKTLVFRPARVTQTPRTTMEHAIVVGTAGKEIFTDKYGRVKVQFLWDRTWPYNEKSSCWIRVATPWAGPQWGMIHIPRIGHEVIVDFLGGDPDQPVILGSVYNNKNMPPYTLPDNATQSGIKSRSSLKGQAEHFNEIRFEDLKGSEQVYVHAQKNFDRVVENNDTLKVGSDDTTNCPDGSQTISVWKDRTETVETGNELVTIKKGTRIINVDTGDDTHNVKKGKRTVNTDLGDDTHNVKTGKRVVNTDKGDDTLTVGMGKRTVNVKMGDHILTVSLGNQKTDVTLGSSTTTAMQAIELKVGANSIKIDQSGITLKGLMITVDGTVMTTVKAGVMCKVEGSAITQIGGGIIMIG